MWTFGRVLATLATGVITYLLATRFFQPDRPLRVVGKRLLLYGYKIGRHDSYDPNGISRVAIATIGPDGFSIEREYPFEDCFLTSAAGGGKPWLLLRNDTSGEMTIGLIDPDYKFRRVKVYPGGSYRPWAWATVDGRGYLMLTGMLSPKVGVGFAQVLDDGTFVEWWRTDLDIPFSHEIVGLKYGHAWIRNDTERNRGTVYIFDVKSGQMLSTRTFDREIDRMIVEGDRVCLFTRDRLITEICVIDRNHQLVSVKYKEYDAEFADVSFYLGIASTPAAHLLYGRYPDAGSKATVCVFEPGGLRITHRFRQPAWPWLYVEPC